MRVRKYTDGGELEWNRIGKRLNQAYYDVPESLAPIQKEQGDPTKLFGIGNPFQGISPVSNNRFNAGQYLSSLKTGLSNVAPFASNIVNSLRTPPMPRTPTMDNLITLQAPSYENERNEVSRQINADSELASRSVDGQTAASIRLFNTGQKLDRLSGIREHEANSRIAVGNEQARVNAGIMASNNRKIDQFNESLTERDIANQREKSANLSNFSDKIVGMQNEAEKRRVDLEKTKTLSHMFDNSGVLQRLRKQKMEAGETDPFGIDYSDIKTKFARGGYMPKGGSVPRRAFYRNLQGRAQTLKSLYKTPA